MDLKLLPAALKGSYTPPPSKSLQHRHILAQVLATGATEIVPASEDAERTKAGILQLLCGKDAPIDCGASGTTLRFLMPLAAVLAPSAEFTGTERLFARPLGGSVPFVRTEKGIRLAGEKLPSHIAITAEQSSQELSGLLFALPLMDGEHTVQIQGPCVSRPYVTMTREVLRQYGIVSEKTEDGYIVPGRQRYCMPQTVTIERDWSAAAFFLAAQALGQDVTVQGLSRPSLQGDAAAERLLAALPGVQSLADTPDLLPPLALYGALCAGAKTTLTGLGRLRGKESDRLESVAALLRALGAEVTVGEDTMTLYGVQRLHGGSVDARGDHRIAMLAAIAAAFSNGEILLHGAETVGKSYPEFWNDDRRLGGLTEEV